MATQVSAKNHKETSEGGLGLTEPKKYKVIVSLEPPIILVDSWSKKPSKDAVLEMMVAAIRDRKYDDHFHIVVVEA